MSGSNRNSSSAETGPAWRVVFEPIGVGAEIADGCSVLAAAAASGIRLRTDCGGHGSCGSCRVALYPAENASAVTAVEQAQLSQSELAAGYRLACEAAVTGPLRVMIPAESFDSAETHGKNALGGEFSVDPMITRKTVNSRELAEPGAVCRDLEGQFRRIAGGDDQKPFELSTLRTLGTASCWNGDLTLVSHRVRGITAVVRGASPVSLGLAFDIGTTSLAGYLCDLTAGTILSSASSANPQRRFGEDVVSRIAYCDEHDDGVAVLKDLVVEALNTITEACLKRAGHEAAAVDEVCVVGNPTMQQLFLGISPGALGRAPYLPVVRRSCEIRAEEAGLRLNPGTNVHVFPVASGFIGGDTVAAVLADGTHQRREVTLLVDIGTNGELVLGNREHLWATSCATGPALEGAHISCGMRAVSQAISTVTIDPESCRAGFETIGPPGTVPLGLCGSGILDTVAEMLKAELLLPNGRLREGRPGIIEDRDGIGREFVITGSGDQSDAQRISISLSDIRQVQLAKAALRSGIALLLKHAGLDGFDRLVLTGAFGARFNWRNALAVGMFPPVAAGASVETMLNGAGNGAVKALLSRRERQAKDRIGTELEVVELANHPDFMECFYQSIDFHD